MRSRFTESIVEDAALAWLAATGWNVLAGPEMASGAAGAERTDYGQVVLEGRLRAALARINPELPEEALDDAFRKLTHPEGPTLEVQNRALHRMLVDGAPVEYRTADGAIRGAPARVVDFGDPLNNDLLAANQFTVVENRHTRRPDVVLFVNGLPLGVIEPAIEVEILAARSRGENLLLDSISGDTAGVATDLGFQCRASAVRPGCGEGSRARGRARVAPVVCG